MERSTVGSVLRTTQAWCLLLCETETLDFGIAYYCDRFPDLPEANQFREVIATDPGEVATAFDEASAWFGGKKLRCRRWAPAAGGASPALRELLLARGLAEHSYAAFSLRRWPELKRSEHLRVLPARAMRDALYELLLAGADREDAVHRTVQADAWIERLDEPQLDLFVAMHGAAAVGYAGLFQVGDIARVLLPTVLPEASAGEVASTLLGDVLSLTRRLALANVVTMLDSNDKDGQMWLESCGFVEDGRIMEFDCPNGVADK